MKEKNSTKKAMFFFRKEVLYIYILHLELGISSPKQISPEVREWKKITLWM